MFGIPLHPLVVHFPIVLAILLPIAAVVALWAIRRGTSARRGWAVPLALAAALALGAFVATKTGDLEEDRVERIVPRRALHDHEEEGERFFIFSGILLLVTAAGLLHGRAGRAARIVSTAGAIGLVVAAVQVGHSGGTLVYRYDAARAYAADFGTGGQRTLPPGERDGGADR